MSRYIEIPTSYLQGVSGRVQVRLTCAGSHALRPVGVTCRRPDTYMLRATPVRLDLLKNVYIR